MYVSCTLMRCDVKCSNIKFLIFNSSWHFNFYLVIHFLRCLSFTLQIFNSAVINEFILLLQFSHYFLPYLQRNLIQIEKITDSLYWFPPIIWKTAQAVFCISYLTILQRNIAYTCDIFFLHMWQSHGKRKCNVNKKCVINF